VARLVPLRARGARAKRKLGALARRARIPRNFDAALPDAVIDAFEGR
jgi:antitoxin (DNA-binding transcriptional repressor) of toxin-antitoxin stability system